MLYYFLQENSRLEAEYQELLAGQPNQSNSAQVSTSYHIQ